MYESPPCKVKTWNITLPECLLSTIDGSHQPGVEKEGTVHFGGQGWAMQERIDIEIEGEVEFPLTRGNMDVSDHRRDDRALRNNSNAGKRRGVRDDVDL